MRARDRICRSCGATPQQNGRALDVHHLDPFRFSGEHDLDRLVALCRRCHMRADDHGRAGSASYLRAAGRPVRPTKRELARLRAGMRAAARRAERAERVRDACARRVAGQSLRRIARDLGVSHQTVANWLAEPPETTAREARGAYGGKTIGAEPVLLVS